MCGIAGYLRTDGGTFSCDESVLATFHESIRHRGPDGYGTWHSNEHKIAFIHRRLSIIDLSQAGHQPMLDPEQSVVLTFNGEIYNHLQLRTELEQKGYVYRSHTDTETILYAYKEWGIDCIKRFEGMFAFALYDLRTQECFFVRDRIGIKPLYFSLQGGYFSFASEIKALWQLPWMKKELSKQGFYHYLTYMVAPAPFTLFEGVYKLPAGFYAKLDAHKHLTFNEWYSPVGSPSSYDPQDLQSEEFCVAEIRRLLRESIKKRMMSDVPFGVFLSGGVDSSLNVALMSEFTDTVKTFTVSFSDGPEYSEVEWARKVAHEFGTDHHETVIDESDAFNFFNKMVYHQDEPIADCVCIPLYYVAQLLKNTGVTVVQVGEGSDELFCGYDTYARYLDSYNTVWKRSHAFVPSFAKKAGYFLAARMFPHKKNHLFWLRNWAEDRNAFWSGALVFTEMCKKPLLKEGYVFESDPIVEKIFSGMQQIPDSYAIVDYHLRQLRSRVKNSDFLLSMIYLEFKQRLSELLLGRVDKMTMATSVEGRVPFLDHAFVEFALQIPSWMKYKNGMTKYILKKAAEGILPHDVIYRKKMGFAAPTKRWFRQDSQFSSYFDSLIHTHNKQWDNLINPAELSGLLHDHKTVGVDYATQLWVLQNAMSVEL